MNNPKPTVLCALSWMLLIGLTTLAHTKQQVESPVDTLLDQAMPSVKPLQNVTVEDAFATVIFHAGLSGGIIEVNNCTNPQKPTKTLHSYVFSSLTVRQALDLVVADDAGYKWEANEKTVDLVPIKGIPAVMSTSIAHFEIGPKEVVGEIGAKLFNEPLVKKTLGELGLKLDGAPRLIIGGREPDLGKSLQLEDTTVMNALNVTASLNKYPAVWHYTESVGHCEHTYSLEWPVR
jgi:hypothetical protein